MPSRTQAAAWPEHRTRGAAGHVAAGRARPTASAPTRSPRRSARASRPPTTCSPACATRASPCAGRAASTSSRRRSARPSRRDARRRPPRPRRRRRRPARAHAQARLPRRCSAPAQMRIVLERGAAGHAEAARAWSREIARQRARAGARQGRARARARAEARRALPAAPACGASRAAHDHRPDALRDELREVRRTGFAVDREEFDDDFCCIAAPVLDARGRFLGAVGISMSRRAFDDEHEKLAETAAATSSRWPARSPARRLAATSSSIRGRRQPGLASGHVP